MTLEEMVGRQIMIGVAQHEVSDELVRLFQETHAAGLIVFRRNFHSPEQFRHFLKGLEESIQRKLLVGVDHEGGRVRHFDGGVTVFPDNRVFGKAGRAEWVRQQGSIEAAELRSLGVDINFSPVLDLFTEKFNPIVGNRGYHSEPEKVSEFGCARIKGMQDEGLSACAKHFPGLGPAGLDPHHALPEIDAGWKEMRGSHLKPFEAAVRSGVHAVMTSHPSYSKLDPDSLSCTFSEKIVRNCLRHELGFKGVVFSDDLEMGALNSLTAPDEAAFRAVRAGHDMVLICSNAEFQRRTFRRLCEAYRAKSLAGAELEASLERIEKLKSFRQERFTKSSGACGQGGVEVSREALRLALAPVAGPCFSPRGGGPALVIFPGLSRLSEKFAVERPLQYETAFLKENFSKKGLWPITPLIVGLEPSDGEINEACHQAENHENVVFFCYDAHASQEGRRLLTRIQLAAKNLAVVFLKNPYDMEYLRKDIMHIDACGFTLLQIEQAIAMINLKLPISKPESAIRP